MVKASKIAGNNRGIALLITISITTVLVAAALEYNRRARYEVHSTAAVRDRMTLSYMASSGVHAAMAMLIKDKSESNFDSLQEDWANSDKINELLAEIPFDDGKLSVTITDEMGKIQVNALVSFPDSQRFNESQRRMWERLLNYTNTEEDLPEDRQPAAIINSVKDWLDSGDDDAITGLSGAETSYYEDLDPPYASRNGPIADIGGNLWPLDHTSCHPDRLLFVLPQHRFICQCYVSSCNLASTAIGDGQLSMGKRPSRFTAHRQFKRGNGP